MPHKLNLRHFTRKRYSKKKVDSKTKEDQKHLRDEKKFYKQAKDLSKRIYPSEHFKEKYKERFWWNMYYGRDILSSLRDLDVDYSSFRDVYKFISWKIVYILSPWWEIITCYEQDSERLRKTFIYNKRSKATKTQIKELKKNWWIQWWIPKWFY